MTREQIKIFWDHINNNFEKEEINVMIEDFEFKAEYLDDLNSISDEELPEFVDFLIYMTLNELYDGVFEMMFDTLVDVVGVSENKANELLAW